MKRKIFIHIGAHKCASKTIQRSLKLNKELLKEKYNIHYLGGVDFFYEYFFSFFRKSNFLKNISEADLKYAKKNFQQIISSIDSHSTILMSSEGFLGGSDLDNQNGIYPHASSMLTFLRGITENYDVSIILIVRKQDAFIQSCYLQQIKERRCLTFEEFYKNIAIEKMSWFSIAESIELNFGKENTMIFPFEFILHHGTEAFLQQILAFILPSVKFEGIKIYNHGNPSLSSIGLDLALKCYPFFKQEIGNNGLKKFANYIFRNFSSIKYPKVQLWDIAESNEILGKYKEENKKLFYRYIPNCPPELYFPF
ncbi:hypothetical protein [Legionella oakridgensis]|uniref:hypothetical protein n=1 Tax=Legionella oakridgensis TaxID=29423 RepID=UPI0003DDFCC3|nr:hypothetical protein [Legionella oakridgensis]ETO94526.1 hypothetical protein LOR_36c03590 [Legionella oakridgensis RV-2-2007]